MKFILSKSTFLLAVCALLLGAAGAARADAPNLIKNGNFENLQNGQAADWGFSSANPEIFALSFPDEKDHGNAARMDVSSAVMSGYFNQNITLKPHTNYRFSGLAKLNKGKILIYIHSGADKTKVDTRIYVQTLQGNPLVPWFWDKKWIEGSSGYPNPNGGLVRTFLADPGVWQPVSIDFNSGELTDISISLGAYFEVGQYEFDDVSVTEIPTK